MKYETVTIQVICNIVVHKQDLFLNVFGLMSIYLERMSRTYNVRGSISLASKGSKRLGLG